MIRFSRSVVATLGLVFALASTTAQSGDSSFRLSAGVEYTSGEYGGTEDIEDIYIPITGTLNLQNVAFSLTIPYLSFRAPSGTTVTGPGGGPVPGSGPTTKENGLGDVVAGVTVYDVFVSDDKSIALDLVGRVKFGTADKDKGLGTGEEDFLFRADLYKFFERFTLIGSGGYKLRGDPADIDLQNGFLASIGVSYALTTDSSAGLFYDYRESSLQDSDALSEVSLYSSHSLGESWYLQLYVLAGFSDSSPDWGGGIVVSTN
jgi:hypothetical protein